MGDAYECLGPVDGNVPDAPEPAVPTADAPQAAAPLRDDGIDLNSNPLSNKETEKGKGKSKEPAPKGHAEQKTSKSQMTTKSAPITLKNEHPQKKKGKSKGKGKKSKKMDPKMQSKIWVGGFIVSTLFFGVCVAMLIFVAGHRWFGIKVISAIAFE